MNGLDVVILIVIAIGALMGLMKGFLRQLASILGLVIGLLAARMLYMPLAEKLSPVLTDSMTTAQILSFLAIWAIVPILFTLVAFLLSHALDLIALGWINRLLGMVLGAVKYALFIMLVIHILDYLDEEDKVISRTSKEESTLYYQLKGKATCLFPMAKGIYDSLMEEDEEIPAGSTQEPVV
ncbi:MAG: CvpA family protein [Bacteroides sp.]|nr:CvpA family protein [Bacteroides sp.]